MLEINILKFIHENLHGSAIVNQVFKYITILGDVGAIWIALSFVLLFINKTRKAGIFCLIGLACCLLFNNLLLKNIFDRIRPFVHEPSFVTFLESIGLKVPGESSFPSGHAFSSFCSATIISLTLKKKWPFVYVLAFAIAVSRVFLCVHYVTDVLAGAALGSALGVGVYFAGMAICKKFANQKEQ